MKCKITKITLPKINLAQGLISNYGTSQSSPIVCRSARLPGFQPADITMWYVYLLVWWYMDFTRNFHQSLKHIKRTRWSSQRTHDAIITSLLRQNDVATSFWHNNDVVIASFVRWGSGNLTCEFMLPSGPADTWRKNNVTMTSKRHRDVILKS